MNRPADWLAQLILDNLDPLADQAHARSSAQIAWYRTLPAESAREMFARDYQALARVLDTGDNGLLRTYTEQVGADRIGRGAPAAALIAAATVIEDVLGPVIHNQAATPAQANEGARRVQSLTRNVRMIFSAINLQLINQSPRSRADRETTTAG